MFKIILQVLLAPIFSYMTLVFMKKSASSLSGVNWEKIVTPSFNMLVLIIFNWRFVPGHTLAGFGAVIYLLGLSKNDLGVVFPVLGALGFLVLPLAIWQALNKTATPGCIIVADMLIVARG